MRCAANKTATGGCAVAGKKLRVANPSAGALRQGNPNTTRTASDDKENIAAEQMNHRKRQSLRLESN